MFAKRRSISCFVVVRVEWRKFERKVGTGDSTWIVAIVGIGAGSSSLVSVNNIAGVGG
jgi:hypothetical protein